MTRVIILRELLYNLLVGRVVGCSNYGGAGVKHMLKLICLDPGGRRAKDQIRTKRIAAFITEEKHIKSVYKNARSVG